MALRRHDVVLAEGRFQVVLTDHRRLFAVIDAPVTALGPLRIAVEIERILPTDDPLRRHLVGADSVGSLFGDIGHAFSSAAKSVAHGVEHAAEGAFNAASHAVTTLARPVFNVVRDGAAMGMHAVAQHLPFLPEKMRKQIEAASKIVMRARLGDLSAKEFIRGVVGAVRAGVAGARAVGDALLTAKRLVAHVMDAPFKLAEQIPGIGKTIHTLSPFHQIEEVTSALQHGDFRRLGKLVKEDLSLAQSVVSLVPGVGSGISAAIAAGEAVLEGGSPLEIAIHAAYGAIPIPPGLRQITDVVLDAVLALATKGGDLTEAAIAGARDAVASGLPRDVFDTLVHLVVKKRPLKTEAHALVDHYVKQFTTVGAVFPHEELAEVLS
jgi:hypothetical protein